MSRKMTLWFALALTLVATQAQAGAGEWMVNLNGGVASPLGDFKDSAKLGFMGGVGFDYGVSQNLALGVDGSFISNSGSEDFETLLTTAAGTDVTASFSMLQGGAHLKYNFPMASESSIAPYVVGGAGIYNVKNKLESTNALFNGDASESKFGARGGLGLMYKTSQKVGIGIEGTYHWINTKETDPISGAETYPSTTFFGVQAGVTIGLGTPSAQ